MHTSKYLSDLLKASHYSKKELVSELGYRNLNKGVRRLEAAFRCPQLNKSFSRMVVTTLGGSLQLFDAFLQQDCKVEFEPAVHLIPSRSIPKYPLYSRYALKKELRMPLVELSKKVAYDINHEPLTLSIMESLSQELMRYQTSENKYSEIRFVLSNYLVVNMPIGEKHIE